MQPRRDVLGSIRLRFKDELADINPKSWLSRYRKTSIGYLIKMAIFYHLIAIAPAFMAVGGEQVVTGKLEQHTQFSLSEAITAGPFEETLFFGIPFSLSGNPYVVLVTGVIWSLMHLLNGASHIFVYSDLTYANFAFTLPLLFFSLRMWRSGKGWLSVLFHSGWDVIVFTLTIGLTSLTIFNTGMMYFADIGIIFISAVLIAITFPLYRWRLKRDRAKVFKDEEKKMIKNAVDTYVMSAKRQPIKSRRLLMILISGSVILVIGNLVGSLQPSDTLWMKLIHERYAKGNMTENNPFFQKVWLYDNEHVTGYVYSSDSPQAITVKVVSPDGRTVLENTFNRYLWLDFNTKLPPGEFTFIVSPQSAQNANVQLALNNEFTMDAATKEIIKEKSSLPNLLRFLFPAVTDIFGCLVIGLGFFFVVHAKNKTMWWTYRTLLCGVLIFVVGFVMYLNAPYLDSYLVDYSNKAPIPQKPENFNFSFFISWSDYIFYLFLPFLAMITGIIMIIIGGQRTIQRRRVLERSLKSDDNKLSSP